MAAAVHDLSQPAGGGQTFGKASAPSFYNLEVAHVTSAHSLLARIQSHALYPASREAEDVLLGVFPVQFRALELTKNEDSFLLVFF